jgi:molecular chaperone GrpE
LAAELDNTRKRFENDREMIADRSRSEVIAALFPVFDNFYRASTHAPAISAEDFEKISEDDFKKLLSYISGLQQIEKQLEAALSEMGLARIQTKGAEFDPELHEAISHEDSDVAADHIIDEVEAGWLLNGKVLRPAKVRVSKG